mgnify:CR=1 FL=1
MKRVTLRQLRVFEQVARLRSISAAAGVCHWTLLSVSMKVKGLELPAREAEQRVERAQRGAERDELLAQLEELASWYRDLVVVGVGAEQTATHVDMLDELRADATHERLVGAERAAEAVRETWRRLVEVYMTPQLALEALFVEIPRELHD